MYAIVHSKETGEKWPKALEALKEKYETKWPSRVKVFCYANGEQVSTVLPQLSEFRPAYTCFLAHYSEVISSFVVNVHRLTRKIDPTNPYTDTVWGILTGINEEDVLFAINEEGLTVRRVLAGTPVDLNKFESGSWYNEGVAGASVHKVTEEEGVINRECPLDATSVLTAELSSERNVVNGTGVDMMVTSGHATERDWNIGYSFRSGQFICPEGEMVGRALDGSIHPIKHNGKPKILSAAGNCLIGNIDRKNCMALAWMHSVGVVQMTGYLVPTWYGYGGWGVHKYFIDMPGALSFSQSFFANNQSLIYKLHSEYPEAASVTDSGFDPMDMYIDKDCAGLLHDRDVVAFYGDPAFEAKLVTKEDKAPYIVSILQLASETRGDWKRYEAKFVFKSSFGRHPIHVFPRAVTRYRLLRGEAVLTCRFLMFTGSFKAGEEHIVIYEVTH